ncbi:hypothetical protein L228DRAFT_270785 [Xylona heveae TC161]|uniref:Uncharacterized protein n=1 Tax=Xylona heveae (strain CBS 132557 / TC161) TaxID=1328760 RepID=A0A165A6M4_XYLHT|nr:hypothetical protein L228DRAFT_270785 [Xylona heveae TC161]KZF20026.1 hypothetical protein L228DRAFT_270785 [Xylona heveae TC161]
MSYEYICVPEDAFHPGRASPTSDYFTDSAYSTLDIDPGNPRAGLAQRLQHLAIRVQSQDLGDATATTLHGRLDEMERLLAGHSFVDLGREEGIQPVVVQEVDAQAQDQDQDQDESQDSDEDDETIADDTTRVTSSDAPTTSKEDAMSATGAVGEDESRQDESATIDSELEETERKARELAAAQQLLARVSYVVKELHLRYEELKHVHEIAIARSDDEARRSAQLASKVESMEDDLSDDCAELTYLKVQLKALETLAYPYMHMAEDERLLEGIEGFKQDWKAVDQRFETRRQNWQVSPRHKEIDQVSIKS